MGESRLAFHVFKPAVEAGTGALDRLTARHMLG
jgi:hypothetical protein